MNTPAPLKPMCTTTLITDTHVPIDRELQLNRFELRGGSGEAGRRGMIDSTAYMPLAWAPGQVS